MDEKTHLTRSICPRLCVKPKKMPHQLGKETVTDSLRRATSCQVEANPKVSITRKRGFN